ncbi:hypothetical protein EATA6166_45170 (plasmid) [Enterobacter asburiae]|nr:hypothetical protein EATA6166_45170 [Enterobacter asburiae]
MYKIKQLCGICESMMVWQQMPFSWCVHLTKDKGRYARK